MRKIYILWPTVRPSMMYDTCKIWLEKAKHKDNLYWKIAVYTQEQKDEIDGFNIPNCDVIIANENVGYTSAVTKLSMDIECDDKDLLLFLTDDFFPPDNLEWDEFIFSKFVDFENAIFLDDGRQSHVKEGALCITLACMTFSCLKKLNRIVFHPSYKHFFCDNEAFVNLKELGLLKDERDADNVVFPHLHYVGGHRVQDEYDKRNVSNWTEDELRFKDRAQLPIRERLKL